MIIAQIPYPQRLAAWRWQGLAGRSTVTTPTAETAAVRFLLHCHPPFQQYQFLRTNTRNLISLQMTVCHTTICHRSHRIEPPLVNSTDKSVRVPLRPMQLHYHTHCILATATAQPAPDADSPSPHNKRRSLFTIAFGAHSPVSPTFPLHTRHFANCG